MVWGGPKKLAFRCVAALVGDLRKLLFLILFSKGIFFDFFRFGVDFGRVLEAKMEPEIEFWEVFLRCFFRARLGIDFLEIFLGF